MNWKAIGIGGGILLIIGTIIFAVISITPALKSLDSIMQRGEHMIVKLEQIINNFADKDSTYEQRPIYVGFDRLTAVLTPRIEYVTIRDTVTNVVLETMKVASADSILTVPVMLVTWNEKTKQNDTTKQTIDNHLFVAYNGESFNITSELSALYINDSTMTITNSIPLWQYITGGALVIAAYIAGTLK